MSSIFKKPKVRPNLGHNGFDLGRRRLFTSPCGMLLPIFWDMASPGEKYRCNSSIFVRTEAIATAAMMRLKAHVDWAFVPITQIYSLFNEFFNGTQDVMSSIFNTQEVDGVNHMNTLPYFDASKVVFDPMNYASFFVQGTPPSSIGIKYQPKVDNCGSPLLYNFRRMWDMLGYGSLSYANYVDDNSHSKKLTLLPYLAYHKIFHSKYFMNDWFVNNPSLYNVDQFYTTNVIADSTALNIMSTIHYRPYRTDYFTNILPSPTFSKAFANAINGNLVDRNADLRKLINPEGFDEYANALYSEGYNQDFPDESQGSSLEINQSGDDLRLSAGDIRATFALDKLLRVTAFAGSHYEDQTLAHFGFKIPQGISKEAYDLGSQTADISINEVVSTATTDPGSSAAGTTLGDIVGKGFGSIKGGDVVNFTAPCHGILMAIYSIEPIPEYASIVQEKKNLYREVFDFYHPELDNLGMQPMATSLFQSSNGSISSDMFGWTYRYAELKTNFDVINESLFDTSRASWQGNKQMAFIDTLANGTQPTNISRFNLFYIIPQYTNSIFENPFKSFANLDNKDLFVTVADTWKNPDGHCTPAFVYSGDNFINNVDIQCFKVSPMSVHSLPKIF